MYTPNTTYYQPTYQTPVRTAQQPAQNIQSIQQQPIVQQSSPFLKGRLVSSIEEARAQTIDFDGSVFYFPDLANRRIYTKQINLDGTSTLNMYELKEIPQPVMMTGQEYVTREEFDSAIAQIQTILQPAPTQAQAPQAPAQPVSNPAAAF